MNKSLLLKMPHKQQQETHVLLTIVNIMTRLPVLVLSQRVTGFLLVSALVLSVADSSPRMTGFPGELAAADHFLFSYLDQWISRINHTMNRIEDRDQEATSLLHESSTLSSQCSQHMRILLESGQNRRPWALKSEYQT